MNKHYQKTGSASFSPAHRLRKPAEFALLISQAKIVYKGIFLIRSLDNEQQQARLGLSVSAKRVKRAVQRNRIKRLARETFRHYQGGLPNKDYLVTYQGNALPQTDHLRETLIRFWQTEARHKTH